MISTYSYSKINTYKNCPQQFKIIYLDKIKNEYESIEAFMGKRVHEVLEWLYSIKDLSNEYIVFDKIINKYREVWDDSLHQNIFIARCKYKKNLYDENSVYKIGIECLKNYYNTFSDGGYFKQNVFGAEIKFNIKIGKYDFIGYIDRIDKNSDGSIDIIDYKTSKNSKSYYQAKNDFQLAIYYLAAKELFKNAKINLNLFYLRKNKIVKVEDDPSKILELTKEIESSIVSINNENDFIAKESILCEWCYFWNECEVKSSNNPSIRVL